MDELPSEAKSILTLAKGAAPKADPGARERVRTRIDAALAGAFVASHGEDAARALGKLANGKTLLSNGKIMLASVLLIGGSGVLWAKRPTEVEPRKPAVSAEVTASAAPAPVDPPLPAAGQAGVAREAASRAAAPPERAATPTRSVPREGSEKRFSLAAEISLLEQATDALAKHDAARARALLVEHRKRFPNAQLREEREGLWVLARCQHEPAQARDEAAAFVRKSPTSLLAIRVKHACGLGDGT